jgi:CYTH domain-containing protein
MEDSKILAEGKINQEQENFYLPEFFEKEFPNLTRFLNENLLRDLDKSNKVR